SASAGDVDITGASVVGYMGWLWSKQAAVSGTPKLTLNGVDYASTQTTSPAIHRQCVTTTSYPSDAAAIGMVSGGTADDTFLYECGVVVAFTGTISSPSPSVSPSASVSPSHSASPSISPSSSVSPSS